MANHPTQTVGGCVGGGRPGGPPSFAHLDFSGGDQGVRTWVQYMEGPSTKLADVLYKTRKTWGACPICDVDYPLNMQSHIVGKTHFKKLQGHLNYRPPQNPMELASYTQYWVLDKGPCKFYSFNHITGAQDFTEQSGDHGGEAIQRVDTGGAAVSTSPVGTAVEAAASALRPASCGLTFIEAMNDKQDWRKFMEVPSQRLETLLYEATRDWGGICNVCNKEMGRGAADHIQSQNHFKELWRKLAGGRLPPADQVPGFRGQQWVQRFDTPKGILNFNHISGEVQAIPAPEAAVAGAGTDSSTPVKAPPPPPPVLSASIVPAPPPVAPPKAAVSGDMWAQADNRAAAAIGTSFPVATATCSAGVNPPERPLAPGPSPASGANAIAAASRATIANAAAASDSTVESGAGCAAPRFKDIRIAEPPPADLPDHFIKAFNDKNSWRSFMEPLAKIMEDKLYQATKEWGGKCVVCNTDMTRGIADHMPSQKHWKALWEKLNGRLPDVIVAHSWSRQWVQHFQTPPAVPGPLLFNHVTGLCAFWGDLPPEVQDIVLGASAVRPPAPPTAVGANGVVSAGTGLQPRSSASSQTPAVEVPAVPPPQASPASVAVHCAPVASSRPASCFNLAAWVWRSHAHDHAAALGRRLGQAATREHCCVCDVRFGASESVEAHLLSDAHYHTLSQRLSAASATGNIPRPAANGEFDLSSGPWVQHFPSVGVRFNHITGEFVEDDEC
eukprot:TRINITY_DN62238_c0_g1_i1.p1 TRINITY_DN62238_c0_g1~~TRINITY_DN62238_c0_g1_i1.p1  ORF type:complete len:743 (+),score=97.04 TRINITY_DN62238_c0_g1_i1:47-2230(+)